MSGTDAGYSIPMKGQTLWLFGDVFLLDPLSPAKKHVGAVSNCALLVPSGSGVAPLGRHRFLVDSNTGLARQVITPILGETPGFRFWPFGGWYSAADNCVYLYYARIRVTGSGPLDFKIDGHGLAYADAAVRENIRFTRLPATSKALLWWTTEGGAPLFGSAVVANCPGEYLYVVGVQERNGRKFGKLARVLKRRIRDASAYEVFTGTNPPGWSRDIKLAADVEGLTDFPNELSVAYNPYLGGYLAVHSVGISESVRLSLAPNPWGPFKTIGEIGTPRRAFTQAFCYAGKEHPELAEDRGRIIYVTYVDSGRYWLQLLTVTLRK